MSPQTFIVQVPPESLGLLTDAFVTSGLRLACNDRTMLILALSCGLRSDPTMSLLFYDFLRSQNPPRFCNSLHYYKF